MKHYTCTVLRPADFQDCTGYGITARFPRLTIITDVPYTMHEFDGHQYYDRPNEKAVMDYVKTKGLDPKKVLILCDKRNNPVYTPYAKPLDEVYAVDGQGRKLMGPCNGGNYIIYVTENENEYEKAVRVHDRYDTLEAWDGLSR